MAKKERPYQNEKTRGEIHYHAERNPEPRTQDGGRKCTVHVDGVEINRTERARESGRGCKSFIDAG